MWIKIDDGGVFEGTLEQFVDCFGGPATEERIHHFCEHEIRAEKLEFFKDGEWVPGHPGFDGVVFCCFKNPYDNKPSVIYGECAVYSSGETLYLSEVVEEVYGWLPIPNCPYAPEIK